MSREELLDHVARRTDLLVFPSLYEEWGYALFEALGQGVPALTFDLYPFFETIDAHSGIVVARDVPALARAIDEAAAGGLPGPDDVLRSIRERFGSEVMVRRLTGDYERIAA